MTPLAGCKPGAEPSSGSSFAFSWFFVMIRLNCKEILNRRPGNHSGCIGRQPEHVRGPCPQVWVLYPPSLRGNAVGHDACGRCGSGGFSESISVAWAFSDESFFFNMALPHREQSLPGFTPEEKSRKNGIVGNVS